jgi:site-specific DNA-methyltransferase (adenine-specific)
MFNGGGVKRVATTLKGKHPKSIITCKKDGKLHPTQKPVALLEYLVKTYTNPGDVVLDNCMGSGSTGVACVNTGRRFIGMELDQGYFDIAVKRIAEARKDVTVNA